MQTKQVKAIAEDGLQPAVSPDGKRLAYIKTDQDTFVQNLMVSDLNGGNAVIIVPGGTMGGSLHAPRWTPDSRHILFAAPNIFSSRYQRNDPPPNLRWPASISWTPTARTRTGCTARAATGGWTGRSDGRPKRLIRPAIFRRLPTAQKRRRACWSSSGRESHCRR
ncbi:MAG: PD40 domain-containing protein [Chloroflexi bacterium]|nr:PD40 domain-containing protein [Chloroflexota bacterium]